MADEPRDLVHAEQLSPAQVRADRDEAEVRSLVATVKQKAVRKAAKVLETLDDATLLADAEQPRNKLPARTAFALEVARGVMQADVAQPGVQINISQQTIILPPRAAPDYSNAITVEPDDGGGD